MANLVDPAQTVFDHLAGPELVRMLGGEPGVRQELMRFQVETATRCTGLDGLGRELVRLRRLAARAAAHLGCRLVASGVVPYRAAGLAAVTGQSRYRDWPAGTARWWPRPARAAAMGRGEHPGLAADHCPP